MKKIFKNYAALAFGALVAVSMTACHHGGSEADVAGEGYKTLPTTLKVAKTLQVKVNGTLPAGVVPTYNGVPGTLSNGYYVWENVTDNGTLSLTGTGLVPQVINGLSFGSRSTVAIEMEAVAKKTGTTVTSATDANVTDQVDQSEVAAKLPAAAADATVSGQEFLVQIFPQAMAPVEVAKGEEVESTPYALYCLPNHSADFAAPVEVNLNLEGCDGTEEVALENGKDNLPLKWNATTRQFDGTIPHFSIWNIILKTTIVDITESSETIGTFALKQGTNNISYNEKFGFTTTSTGILARTLRALFGATETTINKSFEMKSDYVGTLTLTQIKKIVSLKSGNRTFEAIVWGEVKQQVTYEAAAIPEEATPAAPEVVVPTPTHNGGSSSQPGV